MNETKSVKALKKQLAAAIAMVCVAAIALASSTYAWFVSNSDVSAQTTKIQAQSNTAFMSIKYKESAVGIDQTLSTEWFDLKETTKLYPAEVQENTSANNAPKFVTAYGTAIDNGAKKGEYIEVGDATKAVTDHYAIGEASNYNISSAGVDLSNLTIKNITVSTGDTTDLSSAVRVLVIGPDGWQVWKAGTTAPELQKTGSTSLATTVAKDADTPISVYVYYDGNDEKIRTNNLEALQEAVGVTINFSATQPTSVSAGE